MFKVILMTKKTEILILSFALLISAALGSAAFALEDNFSAVNEFLISKKFIKDDNISAASGRVILGDEQITNEYAYLIDGKRVGLVTNQTGILPDGRHVRDVISTYKNAKLTALYAPEHGIDGSAPAGKYVSSYTDAKTGIPVYSIYGRNRKPAPDMLKNIDVLVFDMQDIGARTYTFISSMYKCMEAAKENGKKIIVLDRPNPIGADKAEGFVLDQKYASFVGIDVLPMSHGMTIGELARYFNRRIGADLTVVPMKNYRRDMVWQDTGLGKFPQTSPNIPDLESAFCYMMTGSGENTGFGQSDKFKSGLMKGIDADKLTKDMNAYGLEGVRFHPLKRGEKGGVSIEITDYNSVNPAKIGYYLLATANLQKPLNISHYDSKKNNSMFLKIQGSEKFGNALKSKKTAYQIETMYQRELEDFKHIAEKYYLY